jgi:FKBP-type peptidyl-prolyl cis-trans isomerase
MKKICFPFIAFSFSLAAVAQPGGTKPVAKPVMKPVVKPTPPLLKSLSDSASYAVGISVANFYKQMGIKKLNTSIVSKAINDILGGKKPLMDDATANSFMNSYISKMQAEKAESVIKNGEKFCALNKTKPGVITTASGLQYEILREGTGEKPTALDSVTCHYRGTFIDGMGFDNSYDRGEPITFSLGGVIRGWTEGLQLMPVGSKYKFVVPHILGYGANDYMSIPGGSTLVFEIELLAVKKVVSQ